MLRYAIVALALLAGVSEARPLHHLRGSHSHSHSHSHPSAAVAAAASTQVSAASTFVMPYKDTSINMNWNTNTITTKVSGAPQTLVDDMKANQLGAITLAFASGECGSESWGGVTGDLMKTGNLDALKASGVAFRISTGGASGQFTCATQAGFDQFVGRWSDANLVGVDFDIESMLTAAQFSDLINRVKEGLASYPKLTFSFTLATMASSPAGAHVATPFPAGQAPDCFNPIGDAVLNGLSALGFQKGNPASWPDRVRINLMTMDYGGTASNNMCVTTADGSACAMGESSIQAALNLRDHWGVPMPSIELTPMIGDNDASSEIFSLSDVQPLVAQAKALGVAAVHYWSYDRDTTCGARAEGQLGASPTCNSAQGAKPHAFLQSFLHFANQ